MGESTWKCMEDTRRRPGAYVGRDGVSFGCYSYQGIRPELLLYKKGSNEIESVLPFPETCTADGLYTMKVKIPAAQYEYNYRIGDQVLTDPYAARICGRETFGEEPQDSVCSLRGGFSDRKFNWKDDTFPMIERQDAVMYHLHVRGYTMQNKSGVRKKGTFAGLREKIPYLKALGINQVRLMPVYDFDEMVPIRPQKADQGKNRKKKEVPSAGEAEDIQQYRLNYWGYGEGYYFAPKASYASSPDAVTELKEMVRAFHAEGIEVLLEFYFPDHVDFETIVRCLNYWAQEYHIDGFAVIARDSLAPELARVPLFRRRKLICNWYPDSLLAENAQTGQFCIGDSNDGFMNDCRQLLKGDRDALGAFAYRMRANPDGCARVNYMTNHDGFTLLDLVSYDRKHNEENGEKNRDGTDYNYSWNCGAEGETKKKEILRLRMRQRKNAYAMLLFSQGVPMLLAGDEFGNSQKGNNNPYCHDSELTWTDWSRLRSGRELKQFVQEAIAFRKSHGCLHQARELKCTDHLSSGFPDLSYHGDRAWYGDFEGPNCHLGCMYSCAYAGEKGYLYIAWNLHWNEQEFALPLLGKKERWFKVMDTSLKDSFLGGDAQVMEAQKKTILVPGRTVVILEGREYDAGKTVKQDHAGESHRPSENNYGA